MKIACITQVRDECDIIELFIRINAHVVDQFFIVDNKSVDATSAILKKLIADGFPITLGYDSNDIYDQSRIINSSLQHVVKKNTYDWFLFLDADEFIDESKQQLIDKLNATPKNMIPAMQWRSWVPLNLNYAKYSNPLYRVFNPLVKENCTCFKVAIDKQKAPFAVMQPGNHQVQSLSGVLGNNQNCGVRINHFPVRSADQIITKSIISQYRFMMNPKSAKSPVKVSFQIHQIAKELRNNNYQVSKELLRHWAVCYNTLLPPTGNDPQIDELVNIGFGNESDKMQYIEEAKISVLSRFDLQMKIMFDRVSNHE